MYPFTFSHLCLAGDGVHAREPITARQVALGEGPGSARGQLHVALGRTAEVVPGPPAG